MKGASRLQFFLPVLAALLLWAGMPGQWSCWPLLFISLVPVFFAVFSAPSVKRAVSSGVLFGLVYYLLTLYWIVIVLEKYGGLPLYLAIPALAGLACYMTLYPAICSGLLYHLSKRTAPALWLLFVPALWVGFDWLRSFLFSGFPWLDLGYGLWQAPYLIQASELFGHHGITFLVVLVNVLATTLMMRKGGQGLVWKGVAVVVLIAMLPAYSWFRLKKAEADFAEADRVAIGIVQGNILQSQKWSAELKRATVDNYLTLSRSIENYQGLDMLVWPETALPFYPHTSREFHPVASFIREDGVNLLTGAPWYEIVDRQKEQYKFFNSALLLGGESKLLGKYYKTHLVPYGEYVPLKKYMPFLAPLVQTVGDFTPGVIENPLSVGKIKAGVLLCYESIFPEIGRNWVKNGANVLVNLTNDAWYGKSSAPYQSFAMVVFRAVENRRTIIRSANTGISGFIDPVGRVGSMSDIFVPWAEKRAVIINDSTTVFVKWGYLFAPFCFLTGIAGVLTAVMRKKRNSDELEGGQVRAT